MKEKKKFDFKVVVYPGGIGGGDPGKEKDGKYYEVLCGKVKKEIERYVDDLWEVVIESREKDVCGICGKDWMESEGRIIDEVVVIRKGMPVCCGDAAREWMSIDNEVKRKEGGDE